MKSKEGEAVAVARDVSGDVTLSGPGSAAEGHEVADHQLFANTDEAAVDPTGPAMKKQLEQSVVLHKDEEAMSNVDTIRTELQFGQSDTLTIRELNAELQMTADKATQEEMRVLVLQEENHRLMNQIAAVLEDKQQWERLTQQLTDDNHAQRLKLKELTQELHSAKQEREDIEQMYLEVSSNFEQALRSNNELEKERSVALSKIDSERRLKMFEKTTRQEMLQLNQQIQSLIASNDRTTADLAETTAIREKVLEKFGVDLTYENIESLLDVKNKEIQMLIEQQSAMEISHEQAIRETVNVTVAEVERHQLSFETIPLQYDTLVTENNEQNYAVKDLYLKLEHFANEHAILQEMHQRMCKEKDEQIEQLIGQLDAAQTQTQQFDKDFLTIKIKIEGLNEALQIGNPPYTEFNTKLTILDELEAHLDHIEKQLVGSTKSLLIHPQSESKTLQVRIKKCEEEKQQLIVKLEECEAALKARASEFDLLIARGRADSPGDDKCTFLHDKNASVETSDSSTGTLCSFERDLEVMKAQLHSCHAQMTAYKAENIRMIFEMAKTADNASKFKQNYEDLQKTLAMKSLKLDSTLEQLKVLKSANKTLESDVLRIYEEMRCGSEAFAMQSEEFESVTARLSLALTKTEKKSQKLKRDLEDMKTENKVLEERIAELVVVDSNFEGDDEQKMDHEVQKLRSSLVQAKVRYLEQKSQLTALEKKLVQVSRPSGPALTTSSVSLDAERREFEAALIEMIEMEKKLQLAYEAKQGLELTLQERMEAKKDLEGRLLIAEDKIVELEQQLEQKSAFIATIKEQLQKVENEREKLIEDFARTNSKLERSNGRLEEKVIEFETLKTTTAMLKDERSRLFSEIALLKENIFKFEAHKVEIRDSQELENEELVEQLNELADKIAEIESEKQELCARLEQTVQRSEEDIHQLRERLYMLEEEKSGLDEENYQLERTVDQLGSELILLKEQKVGLEVANTLISQQLNLLEQHMENATGDIASLSAEKRKFIELQQSLEARVSAFEAEKIEREHDFDITTARLHEELAQASNNVKALQFQLVQSVAENEKITASLLEYQRNAQDDKLASKNIAMKLEKQVAENHDLKKKVVALKQMAEKALHSLQAKCEELSEAESRVAVLIEDCDVTKLSLSEKQSAYDKLALHCEISMQQIDKLSGELSDWQTRYTEEARVAEEVICALKKNESTLEGSLASVQQDLAKAVEERDAALKDVTAKDLKIEILKSQQSELERATHRLDSESKRLQSKIVFDAKATDDMICRFEKSNLEADQTIRNLSDLYEQAQVSYQAIQDQLVDSETRFSVLKEERDTLRTYLDEKESNHDMLSAQKIDLQKKISFLKTELENVRKTSLTELNAAKETIASLKAAQAEEARFTASVQEELSQAEGCVIVLVEERDAAKKLLSKREFALEVLSSEHGELQLKHQSVTTELETLKRKIAADAKVVEATVNKSKKEVTEATNSLKAVQAELIKAESRVISLAAECETVGKAFDELETKHESLSSVNENLTVQLESLQVSMGNLRRQHLVELEAAQEKIRDMEMVDATKTKTHELARLQLLDENSRVVFLTAELSDKETTAKMLKLQVEELHMRIQSLESELEELQHQREAETEAAEKTICSLKASESQSSEELESIRQEFAELEARLVSTEKEREIVSMTLSEMESQCNAQSTEMLSMQTRIQSLESELEELLHQREAETETAEKTICSLKALESQSSEALEAIRA
ncbi:hypothetical protein Plhal703r1_c24g0102191 [Plasmopara halstedii]